MHSFSCVAAGLRMPMRLLMSGQAFSETRRNVWDGSKQTRMEHQSSRIVVAMAHQFGLFYAQKIIDRAQKRIMPSSMAGLFQSFSTHTSIGKKQRAAGTAYPPRRSWLSPFRYLWREVYSLTLQRWYTKSVAGWCVERQLHVKGGLSENTAYSTIIKLSTGLNPLTHAEHVVQDVEWNIGCAKPAAV